MKKEHHNIKVSVQSIYLEEHSEPSESSFLWAYQVKIENKSKDTVKLISRYWKIIDANGTTKEVEGQGVVGEQPVLAPGESFEYTSGTPLHTSSGLMHGSYFMKNIDGPNFEVKIPAFSLDIPNSEKIIN
ncbi:MAG: Co2+/Mg2+ efflux protein ApaG [Rickettsiales bacterium]|nr:Co2+/Mg2+ efflux protein ApaG [Rickettsiales bacterium]